METDATSYRTILRSSSVIAGSSLANIAVGILRTKAIALLLGPYGVGLTGLLTSVMTSAATLFGLGLGSSGIRQLAAAGADPGVQHRVRSALVIGNVLLGLLGGALVWMFRQPIATHVLGDASLAGMTGWLGIGVLLSLFAASQVALLQGMRRIDRMAMASIAGAVLGTAVGVAAIWLWGRTGIVVLVIALPACLALASAWVAAGIGHSDRVRVAELIPQWREMALLGIAFMITALLAEWTQLFVRSEVGRTISLEATGHFQAAWTISMQYIGFVLTAMIAEYYPRLSAGISDHRATNHAVNIQMELGLLLGGPVMVAMIAAAPWLVDALYSSEFQPSVDILRWQVLGDVLKLASWPMGFILLAKAARGLFLFTQCLWNGAYALLVWLLLPSMGLEITGIAFLACYAFSFVVNLLIVFRVTGFRCHPGNFALLSCLMACAVVAFVIARIGPMHGLVAGGILSIGFGIYSLRRLAHLSDVQANPPAWLKRFSRIARLGGGPR